MSVQRTLKGSSQSDARLSLAITNNLPVQVQTGYLETMPWLAQFYLHTLRVRSDDVSRGTCTRSSGAIAVAHVNLMLASIHYITDMGRTASQTIS